jgi:hypothetical protein
MGDMLHVVCGRCGQTFEAADNAAALDEVCPYCGEPIEGESDEAPEPMIEFTPPRPFDPILDNQRPARGIPSLLWWLIAAAAVGGLSYAVVSMLNTDNWEEQHVQQLANVDRQAILLMYNGNFHGAADKFDSIVADLNGRDLQSVYLKALLDQARQGASDARHRQALAAAAAAHPAATAPATAPAPLSPNDAIVDFQRHAESFPQYVRSHPILFQDSHGNWRRRQFVVWDVDAELLPQSDPPKMSLKYTCNSRITAAHNEQQEASADNDFSFDEHVQPIHCTSEYDYSEGRFLQGPRDSDLQAQDNSIITDGTVKPDTILDLTDLLHMETRHFATSSSGSR